MSKLFTCIQVETYKTLCSGCARDAQVKLMESIGWKELQAQCGQESVPNLRGRMMELMGQAVKGLPTAYPNTHQCNDLGLLIAHSAACYASLLLGCGI